MKAYRKPSNLPRSNMHKKLAKSISKANAQGYAKRLARKARAGDSSTDIYELVQEKTRRSDILLDLDRDEVREFGVSYDEAKEEQKESLRARLIGENVDDEEIPSEDDEEIDSDDAFEESDEERFAGFFSSKRKGAMRSAEVDLDEDEEMDPSSKENDEEEEEEIGDGGDFIDLVDALDGKGDTDAEVDDTKKDPAQDTELHSEDDEMSSEGEFENIEDARDDGQMAFAPSDDEEVPEALAQLHKFVSNLELTVKKRKVADEGDTQDTNDRTRKRRLLQETTEAGDENEFRVQSIGAKLNLDDLLAPLSGHSSALQSLRKSTKVLAPSVSLKTNALSAPLPQRTQDRLDRQAAYQQTKEEVDKWSETMKRVREAEHLSFPLQSQSAGRVSNLELNAKFKPTTDLERSVDSLLKAAKMKEDDIHHTEDTMLKMNQLSVEEIAQRRSELRRMRELMFRAEIKARRINKIKSKTYRRLRRKEKARLGERIDDDGEVEEGRLKSEIERAKERATLRHKNTGKWAKKMKGRDDLDEDTRKDLEDMLARGEKLRKRIQGVGSDESQEESDGDYGDEELDLEEGIAKVKQDAFDELAKLDEQEEVGGDGKKGKSVFEMKFMKDAMARQAAATNKEVDDFIKEMGGSHADSGEDETANVQENDSSSGVIAMRAGGRVVYRPGAPVNTLARPQSDASSVTLNSTDLLSPPPASPLPAKRPGLSAPAVLQELNPWLIRDVKTNAKAPKKNVIVVEKDSNALVKAKHKLKKQVRKGGKEREKAKDDAIVEISTNNVLLLPPSATGSSMSKTSTVKLNGCAAEEDGSDVDSEIEVQEMALLKGKKGSNGFKVFEQRDLVALAFAGDNVVQSFEDAKHREIATDAPREVDTTIPGWGSWGGAGIKKAPPKPERIKKVPGINPASRADYGKKNIIISEKRDKKAAKYLVKDLPYPYTSKAQFERAMDTPIGPEWNTRVGFQRGTLPRIVKKPGIIIEPLEKLS